MTDTSRKLALEALKRLAQGIDNLHDQSIDCQETRDYRLVRAALTSTSSHAPIICDKTLTKDEIESFKNMSPGCIVTIPPPPLPEDVREAVEIVKRGYPTIYSPEEHSVNYHAAIKILIAAASAPVWRPIDTINENTLPTVILYHPKFPDNCLPVTCSNAEFAKINAAKQGYTLWCPLDLSGLPATSEG